MMNPNEICEKITGIFPEMGKCGTDVAVCYDNVKDAFIVDLKKDGKRLYTHLEPEDARLCLDNEKCVRLGVQMSQLKHNVSVS